MKEFLIADDVLGLSLGWSQNPEWKQSTDINGRSAVHQAAAENATDCALWMLDQGAPVDIQDVQGETALMRAAWLGNNEMVRALVQAGADLNCRAATGGTALSYAHAGKASDALIDFMVASGAQPLRDRQGRLPEEWRSQREAQAAAEQFQSRPPRRGF